MNKSNQWFRLLGSFVALLLVAVISGCSSSSVAPHETDVEAAASISNCGFELETVPVPDRVLTIKSTPLELLLALGLEDRVVGSAFLDGPIPENLQPAGWKVNEVSEEVPSQELLLSLEPDFVFAGWTSNLSTDGPGSREELLDFGIRSYVSPLACDFGESEDDALTFDDVFRMFNEVGALFGVEGRAATLVAEQRGQLADVQKPDEALSTLWYSSGEDTPFVGGGTGTPDMIMSAAGLENAVADQPEAWLSMSWESFVASDPDVIVLVNSPGNSSEVKRERIEAHPAARTMRAVREQNYISVDFATTEAGVRNVDAVDTVAQAATEIVDSSR